jgi:glucuronoarabinoxylan endo-1,4-beta-xylanase
MPDTLALHAARRSGVRGPGPFALDLRRGSCAAILASAFLATPALAADVVVTPSQWQQRIDGFGASSAWTDQGNQPMSQAAADLTFSVDAGVGLSLLRVRIAPNGTCLEVATAQQAQARGAKVWATPWSPPAQWKNNNNVNDGGALLPEHYDDWSQSLVQFVRSMNDAGVQLIGVSAQNEPDFVAATYESCIYTPDQLADFIGNHLGPAFADAGLLDSNGQPLKVIGPETDGWGKFPNFHTAIQGSGAAMSQVGVVASHSYNGTPVADPTINAANQSFWETEVSDTTNKTLDLGMTSGLWVAQKIHQALVNASMNAWHYWWINPGSADNSALWGLTDAGIVPAKRLYVMGNFSRFIRPGFYRVIATASPASQVFTSAYYDATSSSVVIVAINATTSAVQQRFTFNGATTDSWTSWVTSPTSNLEPGDPISGGDPITYNLAAQSVTTLAGRVTSITDAGPVAPVVDAGPVVDPNAPFVSLPANNTSTAAAGGCGLACSSAGTLAGGGTAGAIGASSVALLAALRRRSRRRRN